LQDSNGADWLDAKPLWLASCQKSVQNYEVGFEFLVEHNGFEFAGMQPAD